MRRWLLWFVLVVLLPACGEAVVDRAAGRQDEQDAPPVDEVVSIDEIVESFRVQFNQPAMAAAVVRGGEIVALSELGVRALSTDAPIEHGDRWNLGGVSMSIMATAIARLVERGDIAWDSTALEMFPELAGRILAEYEEVTVRDLLSHRAGLMPFTSGAGQVEIEINKSLTGSPRDKRAQFVEKVLNQPPVHEPGTTFEFSNAGYAIVAALMERRLEKPLDDALRELVFDPLAMTSAAVSMPATVADPDDTWGHHPIRDQLIAVGPGPAAVLPEILEPGNGVSCSIEDFAKFAAAQLQVLRWVDVEGFNGKALRALHRPVINAACMGWFTQEVFDEICHFNRGSSGLFYCWILIWPEQDLAIVTTSNAGNGEEACRGLAEALFKRFAN